MGCPEKRDQVGGNTPIRELIGMFECPLSENGTGVV